MWHGSEHFAGVSPAMLRIDIVEAAFGGQFRLSTSTPCVLSLLGFGLYWR
jgi:hypothetical protein